MKSCFICGQEKENMFPILCADNLDETDWTLTYYCQDCDKIFGFLNLRSNWTSEWDSCEDIKNSLNDLLTRIRNNLKDLKDYEKDLEIDIEDMDYHLWKVQECL